MLFLDPATADIVLLTRTEQPAGSSWMLYRGDDPVAEFGTGELALRRQVAFNRLSEVRRTDGGPWFLGEEGGPVPANLASRWSIQGERTWFIELAADAEEKVAVHRDPVEGEFIAVEPGALVHFAAFCAAHRCLGRLEIAFYDGEKGPLSRDDEGGTPSVVTLAVDPTKLGGDEIDGYDRCQVSAVVPLGASFAQPRIVNAGPPSADGSFVFFLRPHFGYALPPSDLRGAQPAIPQEPISSWLHGYSGTVFLYARPAPLSLFDGEAARLSVRQSIGGRSALVAASDVSFPRIVATELLDVSDRLVVGRVTTEGFACASIPLALCRPDKRILSRQCGIWAGGSYRFAFILPKDPFGDPVRSFSICDAAGSTSLLDFTLTGPGDVE